MANKAGVEAQVQVTREILNQGRYHDVIVGVQALSWREMVEGKDLLFEAIDGLLAVDVSHSHKILLDHFFTLGAMLNVDTYPIMSREEAANKTKEYLILNKMGDMLVAFSTIYKHDGDLTTNGWETVHAGMLSFIFENKEPLYLVLLDESSDQIITELCHGAENCATCLLKKAED